MSKLPQFGTLTIIYKRNGKQHEWPIGATSNDGEESARTHLAKWLPDAEFIGREFQPDSKEGRESE